MVSLALHYYIAEQIGLVPADLFDEIASCLPDEPWPDLVRWFGTRDDIILEASHGNWSRHQTGRTSYPPCS